MNSSGMATDFLVGSLAFQEMSPLLVCVSCQGLPVPESSHGRGLVSDTPLYDKCQADQSRDLEGLQGEMVSN